MAHGSLSLECPVHVMNPQNRSNMKVLSAAPGEFHHYNPEMQKVKLSETLGGLPAQPKYKLEILWMVFW